MRQRASNNKQTMNSYNKEWATALEERSPLSNTKHNGDNEREMQVKLLKVIVNIGVESVSTNQWRRGRYLQLKQAYLIHSLRKDW